MAITTTIANTNDYFLTVVHNGTTFSIKKTTVDLYSDEPYFFLRWSEYHNNTRIINEFKVDYNDLTVGGVTVVSAAAAETAVTKYLYTHAARVISMTDATSFTPTADIADINTQTNTQAIGTLTANAPSGTAVNGQILLLRIKSTNIQTFSWNGIYRGGVTLALPAATTGGGKTDYFEFIYNVDDNKWDIIRSVLGY